VKTILIILAAVGLISMKKNKFEKYFKENKLPNGKYVSIYKWSGLGMLVGVVVLLGFNFADYNIVDTIGYAIFALIAVSWGGPYLEYAFSWNFLNTDKKDKPNTK
jgi:hypothetical protein